MGREINLIQKTKSDSKQIASLRQFVRNKLLPLFGIYVVVFVGVMAVSLFFESRLASLDKDQSVFRQEIQFLGETEILMRRLKHRLIGIKAIVTNRYPFRESIEPFITTLAKPGVTIESITMTATGETTVAITADTSDAVDQFVLELKRIAAEEDYQDMVLSQSTYQKDSNNYSVDVSLTITEQDI